MTLTEQLEKETCQAVKRRLMSDHRRGKTTSDGTIEFIRRVCGCDTCAKWRNEKKVRPS